MKIIKNYNESNYIEMAESEVGPLHLHDWEFEEVPDNPGFSRLVEKETEEEKKQNRKVFNRARQIEKEEWKLKRNTLNNSIKTYKKHKTFFENL